MPDNLGSGPKYGQDLSRVGSGLGRGENRRDKLMGAAWGDTWPAPGSSLDLDFVNNRGWVRGSGQGGVMDAITYTRASSGTYVGPDGLLKGSGGSPGALGKNLLTFPQDFDNVIWTKNDSTINTAVDIAPDGNKTASKFVATATNAIHRIQVGSALYTTLTFSVYAKKLEYNFCTIFLSGPGIRSTRTFNLTTGEITNPWDTSSTLILANAIDVGNGWWRLIIASTSAGWNTASIALAIDTINNHNNSGQTFTGDGSSGILIWGAQLEVGDTVTEYFPTNVNVPRFDYTNMISTINLFKYTEQFNNPVWTLREINLTTDAVIAPDGTLSADKIIETTANSEHAILGGNVVNLLANTTCTVSFYAKAAERYKVSVTYPTNGDAAVAWDLSNGTQLGGLAGTAISASIQNAGNGWYRCSMSYTRPGLGGTSHNFHIMQDSATSSGGRTYTGDGVSGLYLWGVQMEIGSVMSPYLSVGAHDIAITPLAANPKPNGLLIEEARTNRALWCRDATSGTGTNMLVASATGVALTSTNNIIGVESNNILTNGDFSQGSTGWNLGTGWSVSGSQLVATGVTGYAGVSQIIPLTLNACYKVTMTATVTSGLLGWGFGSSGQFIYFNTAISQSGTYTWYVYLPNNTTLANGFYVRGNAVGTGAFTGTVDDISVVAITSDNVLAPNNTYSAATAVASTTNAVFNQSVAMSSGACTFSVWLRRKTGTGDVQISCDSVTSVWVTQSITTEWARYSVTQTPAPTTIYPGVRITTQGDEVEVWGPQIVPGTVLTDYQATSNDPAFGWSKSSVALAKDQTGIDGIANSATSIHGATSNAVLIQPVNLASGARTSSIYLKRLSGSGPVQVTLDGITWSTVDLSLYEWRRVVLSGTVTNPCVGVRLVTDGDSVAMDYAQIEDNYLAATPYGASSPILTTSSVVTRSADFPVVFNRSGGALMSDITELTVYAEMDISFRNGYAAGGIVSFGTTNNSFFWSPLSIDGRTTIGFLNPIANATVPQFGSTYKVVITHVQGVSSSRDRYGAINGVSYPVYVLLDGPTSRGMLSTPPDRIGFGHQARNPSSMDHMNGRIKRVIIWPKFMNAASLEKLTQ